MICARKTPVVRTRWHPGHRLGHTNDGGAQVDNEFGPVFWVSLLSRAIGDPSIIPDFPLPGKLHYFF